MPLLSSSCVDPAFQLMMQLEPLVIGKGVSCKVADRLKAIDDPIAWFLDETTYFTVETAINKC